MLEKILGSFNLNALKKLIGRDSLTFFEETLDISPQFYESTSQHHLLIQAILNSNPLALFNSKETRDYF